MSPQPASSDPNPARRAAVRRTAWIMGGCALLSYAVFLGSMVFGK